MDYVLGLFVDRSQVDRAIQALRLAKISDEDFDVKTPDEYTRTLKGWLERLFAMPEPLSGMEAEGLPHEDARWYDDQIKRGETLLVVRTERPQEIMTMLQQAGAHHVRSYTQRARAWTRLSPKATALIG